MKIPPALVAIFLASATFSPLARAQSFTLSQNATTDSDVLSDGETAFAFSYYDQVNSTTTTVHGVNFSNSLDDSGTGVSLTVTNRPGFATNGVDPSKLASGASANYANILTDIYYNYQGTGTLTFDGLQAGDTYKLQLFDGSLGATGPETVTDSTTIPGPTPPSPYGLSQFWDSRR